MTLKSVYDDPKTNTRNASLLAKRANVTLKAAQAFLRDQQSSQVSKRAIKPPDSSYAPTGGPYGEYLGDVVFFSDYAGVNAKRASILTIMGANSRFAYARAMTAPLTSAKTAAALTEILDENAFDAEDGVAPILSLRTDGGSEFAGEFAALLRERRIPHERGEPGTHERLGRLDRFHGSLRRMIGDYMAATDSHVWFKVLPDLIKNYNERPNRGLNKSRDLAPADVGEEVEYEVRQADLKRAAVLRKRIDRSGVGKGTQVRLLITRTKAGSKGALGNKSHEAVWSSEVYTVIKRAGVNSFLIDVPAGQVKVWPLHSLQVVNKALKSIVGGPKVDKKVVSAKRLEARNISPEENAAALAAPTRTKRAIKKPARYNS